MDYIQQYNFPTLKDGIYTVERAMNSLVSRDRKGHYLSQEERDYLDWAERTCYSYYNGKNIRAA